ncbi:MAG: GpE family phage tail protein [Thiomicrospira sp.]|nr:MAG: GpE family phage tail protein [Thiomicrospira sp.]
MEDWYADIAIVLHFQPSEIDKMTFEELARWRKQAEKRSSSDQE